MILGGSKDHRATKHTTQKNGVRAMRETTCDPSKKLIRYSAREATNGEREARRGHTRTGAARRGSIEVATHLGPQ